MKIKRIHHVAIAVKDMGPLERFLMEAMEIEAPHRETRAASQLEIAMFPVSDSHLELLEPKGPGSQVPEFIRTRGEGLFHVCFEVEDIVAAMQELKAKGLRFKSESWLSGHAGSRIAFLEPADTGGVLFELLQPADNPYP